MSCLPPRLLQLCVDGHQIHMYKHCIQPEKITRIYIRQDVFIQDINIITVIIISIIIVMNAPVIFVILLLWYPFTCYFCKESDQEGCSEFLKREVRGQLGCHL